MTNLNPYFKGFRDGLRPDPRLTVSEWADSYRMLSSEASAEPGRWRTSRTPYLKEIMDVLSPQDPTQQIVVMKGTQLGLTEVGINVSLCYLHLYPCPIMLLQPTETLAKITSKRRITPAIRNLPELSARVQGGKSKDDIGEIYTKSVPGGDLTIGWSNSSSQLRSISRRVVIADDCDGYGGDFGEGSIIGLLKKRTDAFSNRKIYINSTPTTSGKSLVEKEYVESDQRHYFMPCPHCNEDICFEWQHFHFTHRKDGERRRLTSDVSYQCPECGELIPEYKKIKMLEQGKWIATSPGHATKGYWLPSYYSPWLTWRDIAIEFLNAKTHLDKGNAEHMQVWVNTRDGRPFEERLDGVDITDPDSRKEPYDTEVPDGVLLLTAGVDTQDDRFEVAVLGHGKRGELWFIDYQIIPGDPADEETQQRLDELLFEKQYETANGATMKIFATGLDTGGHRTKAMYEYCKPRLARKVFALKGSNLMNAAVTSKTFNMALRGSFKPFMVGTIALKDDFYARLAILTPGDRFVHFPAKKEFDMEFFKQLTAEKRDETGRYVALRKRNEALDCTIYAMVCIPILGADIDKMRRPALHIGETAHKVLHNREKQPKRVENKNYLDNF